jgi:hypothetical protein
MSRYILSINISSDNRDLLENLLVTLEPVCGDLTQIDSIQFVHQPENPCCNTEQGPSSLQRNLFLDKWS